MILLTKGKTPALLQYIISIGLVAVISVICFVTKEIIGFRVVALLLLVAVSLLTMIFDILPVLIAALLSAFIWNFFFIPPIFTFHIQNAEDGLLFLMYFVIALVNIVLTSKIREAEKAARDKENKEKTIKLYNTLINSLSHELRTPISTIIGAVDTLSESKSGLPEKTKDELLEEIDIAAQRLNRQVNNLLNMSRLESGIFKLNLDWTDVNELVFSVLKKLEKERAQHEILFNEEESLPLLKIDAGIIEQVLHNIIYNALLYTPAYSKINIQVSYENEQCIITISDNGYGFPETEIQHVFDKFYRLPHSRSGGTGLGLSIAKGFTESHDGSIALKNIETGGASFTISIPAQASYLKNLKNE
jgi:two-component system sensor histidine kinase KdpD